MQAAASKLTVYEGVLYSVLLPMALLKLIRDEAHGQLLQEAQTDYLTRLGNRRWFFEQGARLFGGEGSRPVAVLAFDLDRFKAVNDVYGHQTGDQVLKSFAEIARRVLGPHALLGRIGGEEFAALLTGDDARRARALGEAVATRFADTIPHQIHGLGLGIPATVSIGLAHFETEVPPLADALAAADQALYRAKSLGGNRLEVARTAEGSAVR
jgi:diguanylate cyclase (GGDEF)-like protein